VGSKPDGKDGEHSARAADHIGPGGSTTRAFELPAIVYTCRYS
jgi:hypothetical protein